MKKQVKCLTHAKVTEVIKRAVKNVYPGISNKDLIKYACHSIRVWACVIFDEAGKPSDFIKNRLRWMSEAYHVYLRDTHKIHELNNEALQESSQAVMEMLDFY